MATIADKLTTIAGIKTDIRTAINGKGGSLTSGSPFSAYSAAISSLPSGGGGYPPDWSEIGYTGTPQLILDGFSYAKNIYDNWDPTVTSLENKFHSNKDIVYMPMVDTSAVTNMGAMFYNCVKLAYVPLLITSNVTNMANMLNGCSGLTAVPLFDTSSVTNMPLFLKGCSGLTSIPHFNTSACTNMSAAFRDCTGITTLPQFDLSSMTNLQYWLDGCKNLKTLPALDTSQVTTMFSMLMSCDSLEKITSLDLSKCADTMSYYYMFGSGLPKLRFMLLKGLGTPSGVTSYENSQMHNCTNWGVDSTDIPDARQSLVDTLLTYSFDRATAGYSTCTIKLSSNSYNQLTAQELADIQAKGYNITT